MLVKSFPGWVENLCSTVIQQSNSQIGGEPSFAHLQERIEGIWQSIKTESQSQRTVLVVPSMSLPSDGRAHLPGSVYFEERLLSFLTLLGFPRTHVIYVSSMRIPDEVVSYYLQFLPGVPFSHAHQRLHMLALSDRSDKPLAQKILERPAVMERIRRSVLSPKSSYMEVYRSTKLEQELALALDLPIMGPAALHPRCSSRSQVRKLFRELELPGTQGAEDISTTSELCEAIADLAHNCPGLEKVIIKLNKGFAGVGHTWYPVAHLADLGHQEAVKTVASTLASMACVTGTSWDHYAQIMQSQGAVVEAYLPDSGKVNLSVQMYIDYDGQPTLVATHQQLPSSGQEGQSASLCCLPASPKYIEPMHKYGLQVGRCLMQQGFRGPLSLQFVGVPANQIVPGTLAGLGSGAEGYQLYLVDLKPRRGSLTMPLETACFLTKGIYQSSSGTFRMPSGQLSCYVSCESAAPVEAKGFCSQDLIDIITDAGLHYNSAVGRGVVFHMIGALSQYGRVGATCIAPNVDEAQELYEQMRETLLSHSRSLQWIRG